MAPKITIKKEYILVEPETVEFWEIAESAGIVLKKTIFGYSVKVRYN
jgi:hypothetical protein